MVGGTKGLADRAREGRLMSTAKRKPRQYVYVVHGFGAVTVFTTCEAAIKFRDRWGAYCDVTKVPLRVRP